MRSLVCEDVILWSETMGQPGFFDAEKRLAALSKKGDPLEAIAALVPWESFRADIEAVALTQDAEKKSRAGRKAFDAILIYNFSDEQIEYQVRDRMSFTRFLGLEFEDDIPDGTTLWLFREKLSQAGIVEKLFERFNQHLNAKGYIAIGGQLSVYLDPEMMAQLTELADQKQKPKSLIAAAIMSFLTPDDADRREATLARRLDPPG